MRSLKMILFAIMATALMSTTAYSQVSFRAGANLATVTGDVDFSEKKPLVGLNLAIAADVGLGDKFGLQPELHFVQKGQVLQGEILGIDTRQATIVNYIEIPVLFKAKFNGGYFLIGPAYDIALNGRVIREIENNKEENTLDGDDLSSGNLGLQLGGGFEFGNVLFDVRFGRSFGDNYTINDDESNLNQGLRLTVGFKL